MKNMLELPILAPGAGLTVLLGAAAFAVAVCAGLLTALVSARRITKTETGLLLREDG